MKGVLSCVIPVKSFNAHGLHARFIIQTSTQSSLLLLFASVTDTQMLGTTQFTPEDTRAIRTYTIAGWLFTIAVVAVIAIAVVLLIILGYKVS